MALLSVAGQLLVRGVALLRECCNRCPPPDAFCWQWYDDCGNTRRSCVPPQDVLRTLVGPCNEQCGEYLGQPEYAGGPHRYCECGPTKPCPPCYTCIDHKCVRQDDCCLDGATCPECHYCAEDGKCVPYPEESAPTECRDRCLEPPWFCCRPNTPPTPPVTSCPPGRTPEPEAATRCVQGSFDTSVPGVKCAYKTPCGTVTIPAGPSAADGTTECSLTIAGPFPTLVDCGRACFPPPPPPDCSCTPELTWGETTGGCGLALPGDVTHYSVDDCPREICVSYVSTNSRPIRVQIVAPTLDANKNVVGWSVKSDSGWRGSQCCDCPDTYPRSNDARDLAGGPYGQITWNKPLCVKDFCVQVLTACGATYLKNVNVDGPCTTYNSADTTGCECDDTDDCGPSCHCWANGCVNACVAGCEPDEWTQSPVINGRGSPTPAQLAPCCPQMDADTLPTFLGIPANNSTWTGQSIVGFPAGADRTTGNYGTRGYEWRFHTSSCNVPPATNPAHPEWNVQAYCPAQQFAMGFRGDGVRYRDPQAAPCLPPLSSSFRYTLYFNGKQAGDFASDEGWRWICKPPGVWKIKIKIYNLTVSYTTAYPSQQAAVDSGTLCFPDAPFPCVFRGEADQYEPAWQFFASCQPTFAWYNVGDVCADFCEDNPLV